MALIEVQNVSVSYGDPPNEILNSINLEIDDGEFVCVLGQTGCGKSTLLRLVLGSEQPGGGRVLVDGVVHKRPDRTRGYVPQKYSLFPDKTVMENITFGVEACEFGFTGRFTPAYYRRRRVFRETALDYLRRIGLAESDARKYPDQLSGGMQQRVAIAQALMTKPRVLLMDEAFSALDPGTRKEMQQLLRELWEASGTTIIFVTHHPQEAVVLGTRVIVLAKETPNRGSRVTLDVPVPKSRTDGDRARIGRRLEQIFHPTEETDFEPAMG